MFREPMIDRVDNALKRHRKAGGNAQSFLAEAFGTDRTYSGAVSMISRWRVDGILCVAHLAALVRWSKPPADEVIGLLAELWGCSIDAARGLVAIEGVERVFAAWGRQAVDIHEDMAYLIGYARGS